MTLLIDGQQTKCRNWKCGTLQLSTLFMYRNDNKGPSGEVILILSGSFSSGKMSKVFRRIDSNSRYSRNLQTRF